MVGRSMMLAAALVLVSADPSSRLPARSGPYTKLVGTWVMDSTNGPDDRGLPKSEKLVFAVVGSTLRITATTDEGNGPSTSNFNCHTAPGSMNDLGKGMSATCVTKTTPDSTMYALAVTDSRKTAVSSENGRLVIQSDGSLRDQYDATATSPNTGVVSTTHHRHIYHKV